MGTFSKTLSLLVLIFAFNVESQAQNPSAPDEHTVGIINPNNTLVFDQTKFCVGDLVQFGFTYYSAVDYPLVPILNSKRIRWFIQGPSSTVQIEGEYPLDYTFTQPGTYTINFGKDNYIGSPLQWYNATSPAYIGITITVAPQYPNLQLTASNTEPCLGEEVDIYSNYSPPTGTPPSSVCWTHQPNGTLGNWPSSPNPCNSAFDNVPLQLNNLLPIDLDPYTVNLTLFNGCTINRSITIDPVHRQVTIQAEKLCNYRIQYSAVATNCGDIDFTYQWSFPGGNPSTSTQANPIVTYPNSSFFQSNVTVTDINGVATTGPVQNYVQPVLAPATYVGPILEVNNVLWPNLPSGCAINNLYSITNASDYPGFTYTIGNVQNGQLIAGGGTSWVVTQDNVDNTVTSFVITATSPDGCISTHFFELQECCVTPSSFNLNEGNISNWLSANNFTGGVINLGNTPLIINGTVQIDVNTSLVNCYNVLLGTNAKLVLQDGVTLEINRSDLRACGNDLWDGIIANTSLQTIFAYESTFSDAKCAIKLSNDAQSNIEGCRFYDNWVGVGYLQMLQQVNPIRSSTFQTTTLMKRAVLPQDLLGTMPYQGHFSNVNKGTGVYLYQCTHILVGDPSDVQLRNEFNDLNYGILATMSGLEAYNNTFRNMSTIFYNSLPSPSLYYGVGIFLRSKVEWPSFMQIGNSNENEKNTFINCVAGIQAFESIHGNIVGNDFDQIQLIGIWWHLSRNAPENSVLKNRFTSILGFGIFLDNNTKCNFDVGQNQLFGDQANTNTWYNTQGIVADGTLLGSTDNATYYHIFRNEVLNFTHGISTKSCRKPLIEENRVSNIPATQVPVNQNNFEIVGIQVTNNQSPSIINNLVIGNDDDNFRVKGIDVQECVRPLLSCDSVVTCGWAYAFKGKNTGTDIRGCKVDDSNFGFVYYNGAMTGPVGAPASAFGPAVVNGNKWWNIATAHTLSTELNAGGATDGSLSPWYLPGQNPNNSENPNPGMVNDFSGNSQPISIQQVSSYNYVSAECQEIDYPIYRREQDKIWLRKVAGDSAFMAQQSLDSRYWIEEQAYAHLKGEPELLNGDSLLTTFFTDKENGNSGLFNTIADSVHSKGVLSAEEQAQLNALRGGILPARMQEYNLNTVTEIYLRTFARGLDSLTQSDVQTLQNIAATCYFQGGQAVLAARSMLNSRPNVLPVQYADSCVNQYGMQRLAQSEKPAEAGKGAIKLYPNPVSKGQALHIANAQGAYLRIVNVSGQLLLEKQLKTEQESISLGERFTAGLYFVHVYGSDGSNVTEKIVLK